MAIPSGSGTEVLKMHTINAVSNTAQDMIPSPTANHIYVILTVFVKETGGQPESISIRITDADGSSNPHYLMDSFQIAAADTFILNDKIVISGDRHLQISSGNAANLDVTVSYIDQDWT